MRAQMAMATVFCWQDLTNIKRLVAATDLNRVHDLRSAY
jgi:hypothetical protein